MKHIINLMLPYVALFIMITLVIIAVIILLPFTNTLANAIHFMFAIIAFKYLYSLAEKALDKITKYLNK